MVTIEDERMRVVVNAEIASGAGLMVASEPHTAKNDKSISASR
jgi:hypothetical protein